MLNKYKKEDKPLRNSYYTKPRNNDMLNWYTNGLIQFHGPTYMEMNNMIGTFDQFAEMEYQPKNNNIDNIYEG